MNKQQWRLEEDIDGCYIYPANQNPDDYCFHRVNAVAKIMDSDEALHLVKYLNALPAFRGRREKRISRAMKLQREHEQQSNLAAVKSGSYIKGYK